MRERKVQRPLLILAPLFFMINSPVTGVVITQVPVPVTTNFAVLQDAEQISVPAVQSGGSGGLPAAPPGRER